MTGPTTPTIPTTPTRVTVQAPAKINLSLAVGEPRADGYHPLATVYQAVSLFDHVTATAAPEGHITLEMDPSSTISAADLAAVPTDERNLAVRAARLLAEHTGIATGVHLRLRKSIPVAAGLAGGSTDAAAALVACNTLWGAGLPSADLLRLCAELGSDVPFCLVGGTAIGSGRGEQISPVPAAGTYHWVLATAAEGLSTPQVYAELDRIRREHRQTADLGGDPGGDAGGDAGGVPPVEVPQTLLDALRDHDLAALGKAMSNDLQAAAISLRPQLRRLLDVGTAAGAHAALVSGSGPTCLFLAADDTHADELCAVLADQAHGAHALHRAVGPVPGARVVDR